MIDWIGLRAAAVAVMKRAYAPYSRFPVGAAGLVDDDRMVTGCNVENASYGVALCAECGLVSALHASGGGRLVAVSCVDGAGEPLMPCGRCRQLLWEHGGPECLLDAPEGPRRLADLLPYAFDVADLDAIVAPGGHAPVVPARLQEYRGQGTVFIHPDSVAGQLVWTGYWQPPDGGAGILEEAPTWPDQDQAVAWGRARTPRVVVVDAEGRSYWAGDGNPPAEVSERWTPSR
jgi:cytidine deaminase